MTDINFSRARFEARPDSAALDASDGAGEVDFETIELLFFAYRDFVGDADQHLSGLGFGRAHHRIVHFVFRNPGISVADLLDILKITKQSLGPVLKQLMDEGYVEQAAGEVDRRQRLLFATAKGKALALELGELQTKRIAAAMEPLDAAGRRAARTFLRGMMDTR